MRNGKLMTKRAAAVVLSSMMVLSPLTAFASQPINAGQNQDPTVWATNGEIFGEYLVNENGDYIDEEGNVVDEAHRVPTGRIQDGKIVLQDDQGNITDEKFTWFLDDNGITEKDEKTDLKGNKYEDVTKAYFKKTITLKNIKNDAFIPSVPDVKYTYTIEPTTAENGKLDAAVASYNGASVKPGIAGGISTTELEVLFHHDDKADGDKEAPGTNKGKNDSDKTTMTKLGAFSIDVSKFQGVDIDPGVYRYILIETDEQNIDGVTVGTPQDILDDVTKIADMYRGRILDVVISKVNDAPTDPVRRVDGIAMHECELSWTYGNNGERLAWTIETVKGDTKVEGYTPFSFKDGGSDPKPAAHSRYYTYDFVIGKELTGRGLTAADNSVEFKFDVTIEAPAGADVANIVMLGTSIKEADDLSKKPSEDMFWTIGTDGKISKQITLKGTEHFEISGLPGGSKVTVAETTETAKGYNQKHNETIMQGLTEDGKLISVSADDADKVAFTAAVVAEADKDGASYTYTVENYKATDKKDVNNGEEADDTATAKKIQNGFIVNVKNPITVTGVVMNVAPYALMVIAAAIFAGLFISKKRQEEEL